LSFLAIGTVFVTTAFALLPRATNSASSEIRRAGLGRFPINTRIDISVLVRLIGLRNAIVSDGTHKLADGFGARFVDQQHNRVGVVGL